MPTSEKSGPLLVHFSPAEIAALKAVVDDMYAGHDSRRSVRKAVMTGAALLARRTDNRPGVEPQPDLEAGLLRSLQRRSRPWAAPDRDAAPVSTNRSVPVRWVVAQFVESAFHEMMEGRLPDTGSAGAPDVLAAAALPEAPTSPANTTAAASSATASSAGRPRAAAVSGAVLPPASSARERRGC